jgi:DNA-binding NarL/FixJ family response regulator
MNPKPSYRGGPKIPRAPNPVRPGMPLSLREQQTMTLICDGHTLKEVGTALGISKKTVEKFVQNIHVKWGVRSPIEVMRYAIKGGHYTLVREGNAS